MKVKNSVGIVAAIPIILCLNILPTISPAYAEEGIVEFVIKNAPAEVASKSDDAGKTLMEGAGLSNATVEYKNAKQLIITLVDPDGKTLETKTIGVPFSPDWNAVEVEWGDDLLSTFGTYTIKVTAIGTDGNEIAATDITFEYGSKESEEVTAEADADVPSTPDTGTFTIFGRQLSKTDTLFSLTVVAFIASISVVILIKKGAKDEK